MNGARWRACRNPHCFLIGASWYGTHLCHIYLGPWLVTVQRSKS